MPSTTINADMHEVFQTAIRENPHDAANHLIYADYLDENGHPQEAQAHRNIGKDIQSGKIHRGNIEQLGYRRELYHRTLRNSRGEAVRARVSGKVKTWKTRPDDFRVPVRHGLYDNFYITPRNADEWLTNDLSEHERVLRRSKLYS